jgi:hypothetical protein
MNGRRFRANLERARTALKERIDAPWDDEDKAELAAWDVVDDMGNLLDSLETMHETIQGGVEWSIANWLDAQGLRHETDVAAGNVPEEHYDSKLNRANAYRDAARAIRSGVWSE